MSNLFKRHFIPSQQSYFLFGPRGTGKSTWLKEHYPEATLVNLLKPELLRQYLARPERLEEVVRGSSSKIIIIDEIQKAPALLSVVHSLIEEKQGWQFILTGSSARKLKNTGVNLLAGRAVVRYLHPLMASEMGAAFSVSKALKYGLVPLVVDSADCLDTLRSYVSLYLEEEVKAEGLVRNMGGFSRFLEVISFSQGSVLNISNLARECEVSRKIVEGYLSVLEDLLLSFYLPVFTVRAQRAIVSHSKFYYFDVGVYRSLRLAGFLDRPTEIDGPGLEGLVLQHLRAWNDYQGAPYKLYYWRTKHGVEVDFILYGANLFLAIEVKNATKVHSKDLRGLKSFKEDYPEASTLLLYQGTEKLEIEKIQCIPVGQFLSGLIPNKVEF